MEILKVHEYPEYLDECCDLINLEWPRSRTARLRSLESSCDSLPTCLILVDRGNVIGHSKLTPIPSIPNGCFVESVVIHPALRGNGLGKLLMEGTEEYAKSCGLDCVYLSTIDKQGFYLKIGYDFCPPVSIYGSMITGLSNLKSKSFSTSTSEHNGCGKEINLFSSEETKSKPPRVNGPPPPPPPPPPPLLSTSQPKLELCTVTSSKRTSKVFMKKELNTS